MWKISASEFESFFNVYMRMILLFSQSVQGLQKMLDSLKSYTDDWKIEVNVSKTKRSFFEMVEKLEILKSVSMIMLCLVLLMYLRI